MKTIEATRMKHKQITKMIAVGECFAKAMNNVRWEWQAAHTFLAICAAGGEIPQQDIEKQLNVGQSSISRNIAALGDGTMKEPGARLVESFEDPVWRRRKLVRLTARGKLFAEEITGILER